MAKFMLQRFIGMLVTMLFVSIIVFIIMELPPGDYAVAHPVLLLGPSSIYQSDLR